MSWRRAWLSLALFGTLGCVEAPEAERPRAITDKRAMFGDAGLVPTREGERARRELAIAGELEQALAGLGFEDPRVDVELREPIAVIVIARQPASDLPDPEATVAELARAMVPELAPEHLHVWLRPAAASEPKPRRPSLSVVALLLACIGLGLSIGVVGERLRERW